MDEFLEKKRYGFEDLIEVMEVLRGTCGCPWDLEQTHESLKNSTLEETYEVIEAINNNDIENLKEELGDLLLHVIFHSKIAKDNDNFTIDDVCHNIVEKLIRRHPHVFSVKEMNNSEEVLQQWEEIKSKEKNNPLIYETLEDVPKAFPALLRAYKVQKKASKVGFDFKCSADAFSKVYEEINELEDAIQLGDNNQINNEYGDLLFSIVNISRFFELNPEFSLTNATEKFINRFKGIEQKAISKGLKLERMTVDEMDVLWKEYKKDNNNQ